LIEEEARSENHGGKKGRGSGPEEKKKFKERQLKEERKKAEKGGTFVGPISKHLHSKQTIMLEHETWGGGKSRQKKGLMQNGMKNQTTRSFFKSKAIAGRKKRVGGKGGGIEDRKKEVGREGQKTDESYLFDIRHV